MEILKMCVHHQTKSESVGYGPVELSHMIGTETGLICDFPCVRFHERRSEIVFKIVAFSLLLQIAQRTTASIGIRIIYRNHIYLLHKAVAAEKIKKPENAEASRLLH